MVELLLVGVGLGVRLADALGDNLGVAVLVAEVLAVFALHTRSVLEKFSTKCAAHDAVELLVDELVAVLFLYLFLALADGSFAAQAGIEGSLAPVLFGFKKVSDSLVRSESECSLKLIESLMLPTGSRENQASTMFGSPWSLPGGAWAPPPIGPRPPMGAPEGSIPIPPCWPGAPPRPPGPGPPPLFICSAVTHCDPASSELILFLRISSTMSEMRIHSMPIGVGNWPDLS